MSLCLGGKSLPTAYRQLLWLKQGGGEEHAPVRAAVAPEGVGSLAGADLTVEVLRRLLGRLQPYAGAVLPDSALIPLRSSICSC